MEGGSSTVDAKGPAKLTPEEQKKEINKAREPKDGQQGTVPPKEEKEGYVADLDE